MLSCRGVLRLLLILMLLPALHHATLAQVDTVTGDVQAALDQIRQAPPYERSQLRADLVKLGAEAVGPLAAEVRKHRQSEEVNYIGHCILALQELKAPAATDALVDVLDSTNLQLLYQASAALGQIWQGKGGADPAALKVNAALLAALNSEISLVALYGPALALVEINGIPIERPQSVEPADLKEQVSAWFAQNADRLPPIEQLPWQVNLRTVLTTQDASVRQAAVQALIRKRELGPVEPILDALAQQESAPAAAGDDLANVLGQLTGLAFPPTGTQQSAKAEQVAQWRKLWYAALQKETDQRHRDYAWKQLEIKLRRYLQKPGESTIQPLKEFRAVLLHQLPDPDAIPPGASPKAKELLGEPLQIKATMTKSMEVLEGRPNPAQKASELNTVLQALRKPQGAELGRQFLGRLLRLARLETNVTVASQFGLALWQISDIPCELGLNSPAERTAALNEWSATAKKLGLPLETR